MFKFFQVARREQEAQQMMQDPQKLLQVAIGTKIEAERVKEEAYQASYRHRAKMLLREAENQHLMNLVQKMEEKR
jgi:hypothetical protein